MSTTLNNKLALSHDEEPDQLISALRAWGIGYLMSGSHSTSPRKSMKDQMTTVELVKRLAQCVYPRIRDASISLFLLHPELADAVLEAYRTSEPSTVEQIAVLVLAALYLQRLWSFRLTIALGHAPCFPEQRFAQLWQDRSLPAPICQHGKEGLIALQAAEQRRRGLPLDFIGDWQNQINHLLAQEEPKHLRSTVSMGLLAVQDEEESECFEMSMRQDVTRLEGLDAAYNEVLPRMGKRPYINLNPERFAERYSVVRRELQQLS